MKLLYTLILILLLVLPGCDQGTDISTPGDKDNRSYNLIKIPAPKGGLSVETIFSATKTIKGDKGGEIKLKENYKTENGHKVKIEVKLKIQKDSFSGETDITLTIDDEFAAISITPAMVFDKPLLLDAKFEGIEVESLGLTTGDCDFVFIDHAGDINLVGYDKLKINEKKGKLSVNNAKVEPYAMESMLSGPNSRYGFVN